MRGTRLSERVLCLRRLGIWLIARSQAFCAKQSFAFCDVNLVNENTGIYLIP